MNTAPIVRDVCLVGGGHSHALLLRKWAMHPIAGVRLTLVSSSVQTPYSGMLPGLVAGHYRHHEVHIDLLRLCTWAGVRFVEDTVVGIDLDNKQVRFAQRPGISFDVLSLDTGSTPDLSVPGSHLHATPVKPVSEFCSRWDSIQQRIEDSAQANVSIGVVGSGAGGFELVTAIQHRLRKTSAHCYWFLRGDNAISGRTASVGELAIAAAEAAGIEVLRGFDVAMVEQGELIAQDGRTKMLDEIVWCTAAAAPAWPASAGLKTDELGFVATNAHLQSVSHAFVFASGDIGTQVETPSSKAGVFAVRQAPVLFENIRRYLLGRLLLVYRPQRNFLSLMATGPRHAIANRASLHAQGEWVWRWKDHIDQKFMDKFRQLPMRVMNASLAKLPNELNDSAQHTLQDTFGEHTPSISASAAMRCRGCGAKVGNDVLQRVLDELLPAVEPESSATLCSPAGDTAVVEFPAKRLVQSVDQINAIVDDPYLLGRISALHAISDVITLDANLHSAQVLLTLPEASERVVERDLRLIMAGLLSVLEAESCSLIGGHTAQGTEMSVGLTINASMLDADSDDGATYPKVCVGDVLIMTKPLGVGTLFAGLMQGKAHGGDVSNAIESMLMGNRLAADILRKHGCTGMTDITGFGLLGHLRRLLNGMTLDHSMLAGDKHSPGVTLGLERISLLSGALLLSRQGCRSSLWPQNSNSFMHVTIDERCDSARTALLVDPQTSGGLLAVVPRSGHSACIRALVNAGFSQTCLIGTIEAEGTFHIAQTLEL